MSSEHHQQLLRVIESQVLPRLVRSLQGCVPRAVPDPTCRPDSIEAVRRFARVLARGDRAAIDASVRQFVNAGIPLGSIFLQVLAPAARYLCERWEARECSFHEVSTGLIELLSVLRRLRQPQH